MRLLLVELKKIIVEREEDKGQEMQLVKKK
jgi:hypothetical protein